MAKPVSAPYYFWFMAIASLKRDGDKLNEVHDRCVVLCFPMLTPFFLTIYVRFGDKVSFYHDVPQIFHQLRSTDVVIAACSRTTASVL
jgi:magnesium-dependent phosphatase 1